MVSTPILNLPLKVQSRNYKMAQKVKVVLAVDAGGGENVYFKEQVEFFNHFMSCGHNWNTFFSQEHLQGFRDRIMFREAAQ